MRKTKNKYKKYTIEEQEYLKKFYCTTAKEVLLNRLRDRTWDALRQEAKKLGLKRKLDDRKTKKTTKLLRLLDKTEISCYWLGFLLADGNFRSNKAVRCEISCKDYKHLNKLANYINAKMQFSKKRKACSISVYDCDIVPKIIDLLGLKNNQPKTYNCPNIVKLKELNKCLTPLLIGFIDGDGCIVKRISTYLIISNHKSWQPFYDMMINHFKNFTNKNLPNYKITKNGYLRWSCGIKDFLINLNKETKNLPVLKRKWSKIQ